MRVRGIPVQPHDDAAAQSELEGVREEIQNNRFPHAAIHQHVWQAAAGALEMRDFRPSQAPNETRELLEKRQDFCSF